MTGIALSGGGARGISHLGILKALKENGIEANIIAGTSAGAILGALYCAGHNADDCLKIVQKTKLLSIFRPSFSLKGLLSIDKLADLLHPFLPKTFEDLTIPLVVTTTEINQGKTVYFTEGDLIRPILASSCVPVIFKPVVIKGRNYVDGGILNNLPAEALKDKVDEIIGLSCNPYGYVKNLSNAKKMMERSALMAINGNVATSKFICDVFLEPPDLVKYSGFELARASQIFDIGYKYALENISIFAGNNEK